MGRIVYPDWFVESIVMWARAVYPDWYVESIDIRIRTFIVICMWVRTYVRLRCVLICSIPDRYVVSPAVFLTVTWSHLQCSKSLRGLNCNIPDRYVLSPAVFLTVAWSHLQYS